MKDRNHVTTKLTNLEVESTKTPKNDSFKDEEYLSEDEILKETSKYGALFTVGIAVVADIILVAIIAILFKIF